MNSSENTSCCINLIAAFLLSAGAGLTVFISFLPHGASVVWDFRWFPAFMAALLLLGIGSALHSLKSDNVTVSVKTLLIVLLMLGYLGGALNGPFPRRALLYSAPLLTALAVTLTLCGTRTGKALEHRLRRTSGKKILSLGLSGWCLASIWMYVLRDVQTAFHEWRELDEAAGGGLWDILLNEGLPQLRNARPFGHPNLVSGFLLLALPLIWIPSEEPLQRFWSWVPTTLGVLVLLTLQSRNLLLGAVLGAGAVLFCLSRKRKTLFAGLAVICIAVILVVWFSPRFRTGLFREGSARWGVWQLAWNAGMYYFPWGGGEGLAPELSDQLAHTVTARWPALLQFHHGWLHPWAVGGLSAVLAILGLTVLPIGELLKSGKRSPIENRSLAPTLFALFAQMGVWLSDYQLDILPIALLYGLHLARLPEHALWVKPFHKSFLKLAVWACLLLSLFPLHAALLSRIEMEKAGNAFVQNEFPQAIRAYEAAFRHFPEPFPLNLQGWLLSKDAEHWREAIPVFEQSLKLWPHQAMPHEFLASLWLRSAESARQEGRSNLEGEYLNRAEEQLNSVMEISPHLSGIHLHFALTGIRRGLPREETTERLLDSIFRRGELVVPGNFHLIDGNILEQILTLEPENRNISPRSLKVLQGMILEMYPEFPRDGHENALKTLDEVSSRNTTLKLMNKVLHVAPEERLEHFNRFWVYLTQGPGTENRPVLSEESVDFRKLLMLAGSLQVHSTTYAGFGLRARHPYSPVIERSLPTFVPHPRSPYPTVAQ
jgi:tetratricopeptide (TPR) repeat protein